MSKQTEQDAREEIAELISHLTAAWFQWAYPTGEGYSDGGLSTLEDIGSCLRSYGRIDANGNYVRSDDAGEVEG